MLKTLLAIGVILVLSHDCYGQTAIELFNRGGAKGRDGDYRGSIIDLTEAIKLDPRYAVAYATRGLSKSQLGDHRGAIADYTMALELDPKDAMTYFTRGSSKSTLGDHRGAVTDFSNAIELGIGNLTQKAYSYRGWSKQELGDQRGAIADYTEAIRLDPRDATSYLNRGLAKLILNQNDSGCMDLSKAGELGMEHVYDTIQQYCR